MCLVLVDSLRLTGTRSSSTEAVQVGSLEGTADEEIQAFTEVEGEVKKATSTSIGQLALAASFGSPAILVLASRRIERMVPKSYYDSYRR